MPNTTQKKRRLQKLWEAKIKSYSSLTWEQLYQRCEEEKNLKNQAFAFLVYHGLMQDFENFKYKLR